MEELQIPRSARDDNKTQDDNKTEVVHICMKSWCIKSWPRTVAAVIASALMAGAFTSSSSTAQSKPQLLASTEPPAIVRLVQVVPERDGLAVEILSSRPLLPTIKKLGDPPRLVIDLPGARLSWDKRHVDFRSQEISGVRVNQYQNTPPITRVVVDLAASVGYTWDTAGNRLMVRLQPSEQATAKPASVPAFTQGIQPAAVPLSSGASGAVVLAGSRVLAGSSVTASSDTAILRLGRGGEVRVCPQTTVSVTASQNGHSLMFGMSTGALEAHYYLDASADSVLTPDFRILMPGPGEFHYAISADSRGDTCIRGLPGNAASVIVSELLGDGTYQVKPGEQVVFHSGRLNLVDSVVPASCGCPPLTPPVLRAAAAPEPALSNASLRSPMQLPQPGDATTRARAAAAASGTRSQLTSSEFGPETAALPPSKPNDIHVQVDAPLVFRASDTPMPQPTPAGEAELLPLSHRDAPESLQTSALPPPQAKPQHHGFFGKIKGFFAGMFS